jgi:NAD(P)-dependent dehydrogenase (short-subunit alcohol dehydrogenase family)
MSESRATAAPGNQRAVAIITGASKGIGRSAALALADGGFSVVLAARNRSALNAVAAEATARGAVACAVTCDVSVEADVYRLFDRARSLFGRVDVLFNNAGVPSPSIPLEDLSCEDWSKVLSINVTGAFLCTREAFRLMKSQVPSGGRIINNGSISAYVPRPDSAAYTASKHAITGLTRSTSLDGRKYGIACGQIDIGNAATELSKKVAEGVRQADGTVRPEPVIDPGEVARAVVYMASLPLETNVQFMTVMATSMPYIGRG